MKILKGVPCKPLEEWLNAVMPPEEVPSGSQDYMNVDSISDVGDSRPSNRDNSTSSMVPFFFLFWGKVRHVDLYSRWMMGQSTSAELEQKPGREIAWWNW
jgi:hypothetical protein